MLALAPIAGWATAVVTTKNDAAINGVFVALLTGTLLYNIFKEELPDQGQSRFWWFIAGVVIFVASAVVTIA